VYVSPYHTSGYLMECVRAQSHSMVLVCNCLTSFVCALRYSVMLLCSATGCLTLCIRALSYSVVLLCCAFWIWPQYLCSSVLCWDRGFVVLVRHCACAPLYNCVDGAHTGYGSVDSLGESAKINSVWSWGCCDEEWNWNLSQALLQVEKDGCHPEWSHICVWGQNLCCLQHSSTSGCLKKTSNSICYHVVCESAAMGGSIIGHVPYVDNPDNIFTKVVWGGKHRNHLIHLLLHDLCDWIVCLIILLIEEMCGSCTIPGR
jgi:hypothetical protein